MLLPLAGLAAEKIEYREVEGAGSGGTVAAATQAALKSCIEQVNGVSISAETRLDVVEAVLGKNDSVDVSSLDKLQQRIETATKGCVRSYRVVSTDKNATTGVEIKIAAQIAIYKGGPQSERLRLAFMPFRASRPFFESDNGKIAGAAVAAQFAQALAQNIVSTRKFAVLDREYVSEVSGEQQRIAESASGDDLAKLGAILGADYIVCGSIEDFQSGTPPPEPIPYAEKYSIKRQRRGGMAASIRIIDVATTQIKFADTLNAKGDIDDSVQSPSVELSRWLADSCALKITEAIYPMMLIEIDNGTAILNQGGDMIRAGDKYELFALGKDVRDPRTGESLGRREHKCGVIQITPGGNSKMSEARILEGGRETQAALDAKEDVICRLLK